MKLSHSRNQGALALAKTGKTQAEIAARVDATRSLVSYWLSGDRRPRLESRAALRTAYGIPIEAWDQEIPKPSVTRVRTGKRASASSESTEPSPPAALGELSVHAKALRVAADLEALRDRANKDKTTTDFEKARILTSVAATLQQLGKLTGQTLDVNEGRIMRLPAWQRIQEALIGVLAKWPDALRAVGEELNRMGGES